MAINNGYLYIVAGLLLLLYVAGFIQKAFSTLLVLTALGLISYGVYKTGLYHAIRNRFSKK